MSLCRCTIREWVYRLRHWIGCGRYQPCRRFVVDPTAAIPGVYCRVCHYDRDVHPTRKASA